jgi:thioredoxin reductase (NADPH)
MSKPILMAVDDEPSALELIELELRKRYSADYEIYCHTSAAQALENLDQLQASKAQLALVLADQWMPEMTGIEFLIRAHALFPHAGRALMYTWHDISAETALMQAMALGQIDAYLPKLPGEIQQGFHKFITDLLTDWASTNMPRFEVVKVVGETWAPRSHELRDLFDRNGVPYGFYDAASEAGRKLLEGISPSDALPVVFFFDGRVLANPSLRELAEAFDVADPEGGIYDLAIVGAGPAGLSAAVYGASEGLRTVVLEREAVGGQAGTSSLIRNYLGFPRGIRGGELVMRAREQATLFGASFYYRPVTKLRAQGEKLIVGLAEGAEVVSRSVLLAMGMTYRRLGIPKLEALSGAGVFYGAAVTEARAMAGQHVYVAGAGNSAGQAVLHLAKYAAQVTMVARGSSLAASMSDYLIKEIAAHENIQVRLNTQIVDGVGEHCLQGLRLRDNLSGAIQNVPAVALFVLIGAQPHTSWLPKTIQCDEWGFIMTGRDFSKADRLPEAWPLDRPPMLFETTMPGVFAAGDIRHRSVKRVASAVGEGSIAIQLVHEYLAGD